MIRRTSGIGAWLLASATLTASAAEVRRPVEATRPANAIDGPLLTLVEEQGPNSGGPGTSADEEGEAFGVEGVVGQPVELFVFHAPAP